MKINKIQSLDDYIFESKNSYDLTEVTNFLMKIKSKYNLTDDSINFFIAFMKEGFPNLEIIDNNPNFIEFGDARNEFRFEEQGLWLFLGYELNNRGVRGAIQHRSSDNPFELGLNAYNCFMYKLSSKLNQTKNPKELEDILNNATVELNKSINSYKVGNYSLTTLYLSEKGSTSGLSNNIWGYIVTKGSNTLYIHAYGAGMYSAKTKYSGTSYSGLDDWLIKTGYPHL
jgi:hypothetical protein